MNRVQHATTIFFADTDRRIAGSSTRVPSVSKHAWIRLLFAGLCLTLLGVPAIQAQTLTATVTAGVLPSAVAVNPLTNYSYIVNTNGNTVTAINGLNNTSTTISVGTSPVAVAVNPVTNNIYVANAGGTVSVISGATNTVTGTVTAGSSPNAVAVNPATNKIYVANKVSGTVTVIDANNSNAASAVTVGNQPFALAVNPVTNEIYVANYAGSSVSIINGVTNAVTATPAVGSHPKAVAVNSATNEIYVANSSDATVSVINGQNNTVTSTPSVGTTPVSIAVNPVTNKIYVANSGSSNITVIDGASNNSSSNVTIASPAFALAVDVVSNQVYVATQGTNAVAVLTGATTGVPASVTNSLSMTTSPEAIGVNPVTNKIYVANIGSPSTAPGTVAVIDGFAINASNVVPSTSVSTGSVPTNIALNTVTNKIYITNQGDNTMTVIDGNGVNAPYAVSVGNSPGPVAVNPVTNMVYVACASNNPVGVVSVLSGDTGTTHAAVSATVSVGRTPDAIAVNPITNVIYVTNYADNNITIINGVSNSATSVGLSGDPVAVAVNPSTNLTYVATYLTSGIRVIDGGNNVTQITDANGPWAIAVNSVTNKIYFANKNNSSMTVIDANNNNSATTLPTDSGSSPFAIAVNPTTNMVYVANQGSNTVDVFNGATNSTAATFNTSVSLIFGTDPNGNDSNPTPGTIVVNPVTNKVYVGNLHVFDYNCCSLVAVIDGSSNKANWFFTDKQASAIGVSPITGKIYVVNQGSNDVLITSEQQLQTIAINANITPLTNNQTTSLTPTFNFTDSNTLTNPNPAVDNLLYQIDSWDGPWVAANPISGGFSATTTTLQPGYHILYAFATDGEEGTSTVTGLSSSPLIGGISAYGFLVSPSGATLTPTSLTFSSTEAGTTSAYQQVTLINGGVVPLTFSISVPTNFIESATDTCTTGGSTLPAGGSCNISIAFAPGVSGSLTGTLTVTDNSNGIPGSQQTVSLSGTATGNTDPGISWTPSSPITYGTALSAAQLNATTTTAPPPPTSGSFSYNPPLGTILGAGTQTLSVTFTPNSTYAATYPATTKTVQITVNQYPLTVAANAVSAPYGQAPAYTAHYVGLQNGDPVSVIQGSPSFNIGTSTNPIPVATYTITPGTGSLTAQNYSFTNFTTATLTVTQAVTTISWTPSSPITYGTALGSSQLNASASTANNPAVPGNPTVGVNGYVYSPASGTVLSAGTRSLSVNFTPADTTDYSTPAQKTVTITVAPEPTTTTVVSNQSTMPTYGQSIMFTATVVTSVGSPDGTVSFYDASAGATCALPGTSVAIGTQAVSGGSAATTTSALTAVTHTILACYSSASGSGNFMASSGTLSQAVSQATPTITWATPAAITYGTALSSAQLSATSSVTGSSTVGTSGFVYSPKSGTVLGTGTATLSVTFTPQDTVDYKQATASVQLVVGSAPANSQATVTDTVPTGANPAAVAVNPVTNKMYVANTGANTVTVINGATNTTTPVTVGSQPDAVAVNPVTNKIYVADYGDGTVTVIDGATNTPSTISVGHSPTVIAVNPVTNQIYVVNSADGTVTVIDGTGNNMPATLTVGTAPYAAAVNPVTNKIYVTNEGSTGVSGSIMVIDGVTNSVVATIPDASGPYSVAVNDVTNKVYVTNLGATTVTVIDASNANAVSSVAVGSLPWAVAVNPVTNKIYVANNGSGTVTVIDAKNANATSPVTVGTNPVAVAVNPITNQVYVANLNSNNFTVIDGSSNTPTTVSAGSNPDAVAVNPVTNKIYIANNHSGGVSIIDGATNTTTTIGVGAFPSAVAVNPVTNSVYVANTTGNSVSVINGATVTPVTVGTNPNSLAVDAITNKVYVADQGSESVKGDLTIIDGNNNTTVIPYPTVGNAPDAVAVNPVTDQIYVANSNDNTVSVLDGTNSNALVATIPVGTYPEGIAVNPITNQIYVLNYGSFNTGSTGTVSVIDGTKNTVIGTANVGNDPISIAVNPVTNRAYVANGTFLGAGGALSPIGVVTMIDGNNNFAATSINAGREPYAVAVNSVTNQIYIANKDDSTVTVIDGVTSNTTSLTLANNSFPWGVAVNSVTNKIYVTNGAANNIAVIDGATNFIANVSAGTQPLAIAVNDVTNQIYVANQVSDNVTALTEQQIQTIPITTVITPLAGNSTLSPTPAFSFAVTNSFTTAPGNNLLYQVDTWEGPWQSATNQGSGNFTAISSLLSAGYHTLYAYATDGEEGTSTMTGLQNSPLIGNITAYGFVVTASGGTTGGAAVAPGTINFGGQEKGTSSSVQTTTLVNSTSSPITFAITLSGSNFSDFAEATTAPDTCKALNGTLPASSSCIIGVIFTPQTKTAESATLTVTDNPNAVAGTTQTVALSGTGTGNLLPTITWTPGPLIYGTALTSGQQPAANYQGTPLGGTFAYSPALATLGVGTQNVAVTFTPSDTADYKTATQTFSVTVGKATLTVSPSVTTWPYAQPTAIVPSYVGFVNGDTSSVLTGSPAFTTNATTNPVAVGTYTITAAQGTLQAANYSFTFGTAGLTVTQATPAITWGALTPVPVGTALSSTQLNATAAIPGNSSVGVNGFVYTPAAGTLPAAGIQTLSVTFTPQDSVDYTTATVTNTLQVYVPTGANFVTTDTSTEGNWTTNYGADGYLLANVTTQKIPTYDSTFTAPSVLTWTYASGVTDPRALLVPGGTSRIASAWYNTGGITFNVSFTDGNAHQFALYALDWDGQGRSETISISDANTNAVLSTKTISNFGNGVYVVWNISGSVKVNVTGVSGPNQVINGIFFGAGTGTTGGPESVSVIPGTTSLSANGTQQFTATIINPTTTGEAVTWTINPSTTGSISSTGLYTAPTSIVSSTTVTVTATTVDATTATGTATITLNPTAGADGNLATFVKTDTTTQGTWIGAYGNDGHALATITPQSIPTYGTFSAVNAATWTYASSTTDPRALETGLGSARSAATWYSTGSFYFDVNFTDGNTHQVALYAVDWDSNARVETIQIVDAANGLQLDSETISGFNSGKYLVWNVSGHVKINLTFTGGPNSTVSGVFFDPVGGTTSGGGGTPGTESVAVTPTTASLSANGTQQFTATITNPTTTGEGVTWTMNPPTSGSISTTGLYTAPSTISASSTVTVTATTADATAATGTATITLNPTVAGSGNSASFVKTDTTTEGTWIGTYGGDGNAMANITSQPGQGVPSYATFSVANQANWTYAAGTTDVRALETGLGTGRTAAAWYESSPFNLNVNITDGATHQIAIYAVDWDNQGRVETIQAVDGVTGAILDSRTLSSFNTTGEWVVWNVSGNVKFIVTTGTGPNAEVSGVFFGPVNGGTSGGGGTPGTESVAVTPTTASLSANGTQQFTATITNPTTTGEAVTWTISPTTSGSISSTGLYTAPATISTTSTVTVTATTADATAATGTATITLNPTVAGNGNSATFVKTDTTTQGTWIGAYGNDGHALATITPQSIPSYGTFSVVNAATWTYASSTTDLRALETGLGSARTAAVWYSTGSFYYDINFTDGNTHQVALYAVDWDSNVRVEKIQIVDGTTGTQLAAQTISGFNGGEYVIWNVSGHVKINLTFTGGPNSTVSGVFFDPVGGTTSGGGGGTTGTESVAVTPTTASLSANGTQQFTATITNSTTTGEGVTWTINPPTSGSISTTGLYTAPATISSSSTVTVTATTADATAATGTATITLNPTVAGSGNSASFVKTDTTTEGTWIGTYGGDGNAMANITSQPGQGVPSYATFSVANQANWTYAAGTTDVRALETGLGTGRTAAAWYETSPFNFDVNITDGATHQFAVYAVDWDNQGRVETIQVLDGTSGAVLDSRTISSFNTTGAWEVWNISGHVKFVVTTNSGPNAEVSGVFFGPVNGGTSGGSGTPGTESVAVTPTTASLSANGTQQFTATITNPTTTGEAVTWTINPTTSGSISSTGLYTAPATISTTSTVTVTATTADATAATGTATITLNPTVAGNGNSATFLRKDTLTQGTWIGNYGTDGEALATITPQNIPSYASFSVVNAATWTYASSTTDLRALETGLGSARSAAVWYSTAAFYYDLNMVDGNTHQFALYALDWDSQNRTETIQIVDATTGTQLSSQTISNFTSGEYLVWNISGHVKINLTFSSGPNAVISGAFFK